MAYEDKISQKKHQLKVISYDDDDRYHECKVIGTGFKIRVDLMVNGDFPDEFDPNDLVGTIVQVNYTHAFNWLAADVKIVGGFLMTDAETLTMARSIATETLAAKGIKIAMQSEIAIAYMAIKAERERVKGGGNDTYSQ